MKPQEQTAQKKCFSVKEVKKREMEKYNTEWLHRPVHDKCNMHTVHTTHGITRWQQQNESPHNRTARTAVFPLQILYHGVVSLVGGSNYIGTSFVIKCGMVLFLQSFHVHLSIHAIILQDTIKVSKKAQKWCVTTRWLKKKINNNNKKLKFCWYTTQFSLS